MAKPDNLALILDSINQGGFAFCIGCLLHPNIFNVALGDFYERIYRI